MTSARQLRDKADLILEQYRNSSEWTVARQVLLQCVEAWWSRQFTVTELANLSGPLTGQPATVQQLQPEVQKAVQAGLLRRVGSKLELAL